VDAGAGWVDASLLGMGQGAGMAPLEIITNLLHRQGKAAEIKLAELCQTAQHYALPALRSLPYITYPDLLFARHKIDFYPQETLGKLAEILEMGLEDFLIDLKKVRPDMIQLRKTDLREYLKTHKLDFDVVMDFIKTGKIPENQG